VFIELELKKVSAFRLYTIKNLIISNYLLHSKWFCY